jgi:hypothetical protein
MTFDRAIVQSTIATAAAALIMGAPSAVAEIDSHRVPGSRKRLRFRLRLRVESRQQQRPADQLPGQRMGDRSGDKQVSGDTVTATWTPSTTGTHVLTAKEVTGDLAEMSMTVVVGTGTNLGSACLAR